MAEFNDIDGWSAFLEARMRVIESAVSKGYSPSELENLVNLKGTQTALLMLRAAESNRRKKKSNDV